MSVESSSRVDRWNSEQSCSKVFKKVQKARQIELDRGDTQLSGGETRRKYDPSGVDNPTQTRHEARGSTESKQEVLRISRTATKRYKEVLR